MQPCGAAILKLHRNGTVDQLEFQIVDGKNKPLLSAETCERLGLLKINIPDAIEVNSIAVEQVKTEAPLTKERVFSEYKDVFEGLGHIGDSSSFVVSPDHAPIQHTPRRVPVGLRKEVKEKIEEMEKKGIITKEANPTEWISNMVVVAKPGNGLLAYVSIQEIWTKLYKDPSTRCLHWKRCSPSWVKQKFSPL